MTDMYVVKQYLTNDQKLKVWNPVFGEGVVMWASDERFSVHFYHSLKSIAFDYMGRALGFVGDPSNLPQSIFFNPEMTQTQPEAPNMCVVGEYYVVRSKDDNELVGLVKVANETKEHVYASVIGSMGYRAFAKEFFNFLKINIPE